MEKGRCQYIGERRCDRGKVYKAEVSPGIVIWCCPKHTRMIQQNNRAEKEFLMKNKPAFERKEDLTETDLQQRDNVVKLELVTGGKGPPSDFWMLNLEVGTIFLAKPKQGQRSYVLAEFHIYNITEKQYYLLLMNDGSSRPVSMWVDPKLFSNQMDLVEVLRTQAFPEVPLEDTEEKKDDADLRSV
jgi:hypothetical protein